MQVLEFDGKKLKALRKERKLTQTEVAAQVGKEFSHIAHYENGTAKPPADLVLTFIEMFGVTHRELCADQPLSE